MSERSRARRIESVDDARYFAQHQLPKFLFQRFEAGSGTGATLRDNVAAFEEIRFHPRAGTFHPKHDLRTVLLGHEVNLPVLLAPVGLLRLGHQADGEIAAARAAVRAGTVSVLSSATGTSVEEVAASAGGPLMYQLYYYWGRASAEEMISRAKSAGCTALVLTIDSQGRGIREWPITERAYAPIDLTLGELLPALPQILARPGWLASFLRHRQGLGLPMAPLRDGKRLSVLKMHTALYERTPTFEDIEWIRERWSGPLAVKGIVTVEDALRAVEVGADALIVSNHGGNGLDGRPATLRVLPRISDAVSGDIEVLMDGGIRRGSDVVKALALGASGVLVGRAYAYALLGAGEAGVSRMLEILRRGIEDTLAYLGCAAIADINRSLVETPPGWCLGTS